MKCKRCGAQLRETDRICLNCGALVSSEENDLYDEINTDDEDLSIEDENDDKVYSEELDALLNSYRNENNSSSIPDYSSFETSNNKKNETNDFSSFKEDSISSYNNTFNNPAVKNESSNSEFDMDDLVKLSDNSNNDYYEDVDFTNKRKDIKLNSISIKLVFIIVGVVLLVIVLLLIVRFFITNKKHSEEFSIDKGKGEEEVKSKYSLVENPNYIKGKTWVCGSQLSNGELSGDTSTYFQYDFNDDGSYAMQYLNKENTYENGTYQISLEEITESQYVYKLTMIAYLNGGYKTRYNFVITTNKEGNKATHKLNNSISSCEEMNYFNNKARR